MGPAKTALVMMILANSLASESWCSPRRTAPENAGTQTLDLYLVDTPFQFAATGKGIATRIFKDIGITLRWHAGRRPEGAGLWAIEVRADSAPANVTGGAMAAASLPSGVITIYLDRIRQTRDLGVNLALFGHVLAHEIGHVLQGEPRHSPEGILKRTWAPEDYSDMVAGRLTFTAEDVRLFRLSPLLKTTVLSAGFQPGNKMLP
ncbi:MAG TPA: hypothetical protein VKB79_08940 [Bryobacteraceae bacterium]|nr:hypothetical protein [Bryobacteraceae bacterium]